MSDDSTVNAALDIPTTAQKLVTDVAQKALFGLALWMTTHGYLSAGNQSALVQYGTAAALWAASAGWAYLHAKHSRAVAINALNATPPSTPAK